MLGEHRRRIVRPASTLYGCYSPRARIGPTKDWLRAQQLSVNLTKNDVDRAQDCAHICQHVATVHKVHGLQMREAGCPDLATVRLVASIGHEIHAELALRCLNKGINLASGNMK